MVTCTVQPFSGDLRLRTRKEKTMKLLCAALLFGALPMLAAEPFTGTWKEDITTRKVSGKP